MYKCATIFKITRKKRGAQFSIEQERERERVVQILISGSPFLAHARNHDSWDTPDPLFRILYVQLYADALASGVLWMLHCVY